MALYYKVLGENIAYNFGFDDPGGFAVERWMLSPGHRANILDAVAWLSLAHPPRLELELSASLRWGQAMPISQRSGEMSRLALAEGKRMALVVVHEVAHGLPVVIHVGAIL